jgi:hypothetical protein
MQTPQLKKRLTVLRDYLSEARQGGCTKADLEEEALGKGHRQV